MLNDYGGLPIPRTFVVGPRDGDGYIFGEAREEELRQRDRGGARGVRLAVVRRRSPGARGRAGAVATRTHPTSLEIEAELWCKDCTTTLDRDELGLARPRSSATSRA